MVQEKSAAGELTQTGKTPVRQRNVRGKEKNSTPKLTPLIKSPSDTTIYAPALNRSDQRGTQMINDISNFVENIRIQQEEMDRSSEMRTKTSSGEGARDNSGDQVLKPSTSTALTKEQIAVKYAEAKEKASQVIVEAEQFKALINEPRGEFILLDNQEK